MATSLHQKILLSAALATLGMGIACDDTPENKRHQIAPTTADQGSGDATIKVKPNPVDPIQTTPEDSAVTPIEDPVEEEIPASKLEWDGTKNLEPVPFQLIPTE